MIHDQDRAGWFGASDTAMICGSWETKSFRRWYLQKLGLETGHYTSCAMNAGTYYEHAILRAIGAPRMDHQIRLPAHALRVNLDGDGEGVLYEVKTHRADKPFRVTKGYWQQVQVQCFAKCCEEGAVPAATIVSYGLAPADYRNFFREIDKSRLGFHPIAYDPHFIEGYLKRLDCLRDCLRKGVFPGEITD